MITEQVKTEIDELINKFSDLYEYDYACSDIDVHGFSVEFYNSPVRRSFSLTITFTNHFNSAEDVLDCVIDAYTKRVNRRFTEEYCI